MDSSFTDITVVVDRSGSMQQCKTDAEGGLNAFVEQQKKQPGKCLLSLVQFDTEYEFVHSGKPIGEVGPFTLVPRGSTALLDAVGRAINETGSRLSQMPESDRPGLVVFVILTDGQENASKEFNRSQVKEMIERQSGVYKWQFTFLGANQDAFHEAGSIGIKSSLKYTTDKTSAAFNAAASNVSRMRCQVATGQAVHNGYTLDEVKSAN